jgi:hypothetical protein
MAQQLTEILNYFLDNYVQGKKEKSKVVQEFITKSTCQKVYETGLVDRREYYVKGSVGKSGNWPDVPWLAIFRKKITTTAQRGVYIVYLLSSDASAIYLTFNQGVTDPAKNVDPYSKNVKDDDLEKSKGKIIQENVEIVRNKIDKRKFLADNGIHLANGGLGRQYEKGTIFYKKYVKGNLPSEEQLQKDLKEMLEIYEEFYDMFHKNAPVEQQEEEKKMTIENMNIIFFGAPGTGKSYKIDNNLFKDEKGLSIRKGIKEIPEDRKFRTTFHPDYDYAQFVGAYKPKKVDNTITYSFVPQVFAKAYAAAWKQYIAADNKSTTENQVYLVIEEINRGNCAQIFGDIFQLLDRDADGFSQYSIDADCDFAEWLREKGINDGKLKLPPNLNILATMNTSDQSLFPMDSAFKRRFDWEYVPISFTDEEGNEKEAAKYEIEVFDKDGTPCKREGDKPYLWKDFVEKINTKILDITKSEDKQLGEFFIKPDSGNVISNKRFLGKVMFYLWNEVCKDEHENESFFRVEKEYFTFQDLYKKEKNGYLKQFMDELLKKE